jgi:hypothetical protein
VEITLATLPQATPQQVFNHVARHLLVQGSPSIDGSLCAYLTRDGKRCAAGCLIGQDEYQSSFEGRTWWSLARDGRVPDAHMELVEALQDAHDMAAMALPLSDFVAGVTEKLEHVARVRCLSAAVLYEAARENLRKCEVRGPDGTMPPLQPQAAPE